MTFSAHRKSWMIYLSYLARVVGRRNILTKRLEFSTDLGYNKLSAPPLGSHLLYQCERRYKQLGEEDFPFPPSITPNSTFIIPWPKFPPSSKIFSSPSTQIFSPPSSNWAHHAPTPLWDRGHCCNTYVNGTHWTLLLTWVFPANTLCRYLKGK